MKMSRGQGRLCGFLFLLSMAVWGCVPVAQPVLPSADACGADRLQGLVGQSADVLNELSLPGDTRIIPPGTAVTMDYRPDRLNIDLDGRNRITRVHCS